MYRIISFLMVFVVLSCGESNQQSSLATKSSNIDQATLKAHIDQLEAKLIANTDPEPNVKEAQELIDKSMEYIHAFPDHANSPAYLFRAGEVYVGIGKYEKALELWEKLKTDYKDHEKASIAVFLQGFVCENNLSDTEKAKTYYNTFLNKYPDHKYVDQVQMLLKNIDIAPEDLIKSFQEKRNQ